MPDDQLPEDREVIVEDTFVATMEDPDDPEMAVRNRIHTTDGAKAYGFQGALVGGATIYGWSVPAILQAAGEGWLDHGWVHVRFRRPTYPGSTVRVQVTPGEGDSFVLAARHDDGEICVGGEFGLGDAPWLDQFQLSSHHQADPPLEERPRLTLADAPIGQDLRTYPYSLDTELMLSMAARGMRELTVDGARFVHPAVVAAQMIPLLAYSYEYGKPAIHMSSHVQNLGRVDPDQPLVLTGHLVDAFERKGNHCAVVDGSLRGDGDREFARIRHTNVFQVRQVTPAA